MQASPLIIDLFVPIGLLSASLINSQTDVYYRPQMRFGKVMFLHLSVSHSVHVGKSASRGVCIRGGGWADPPPLLPDRILRDTVNERVVRIILECILHNFYTISSLAKLHKMYTITSVEPSPVTRRVAFLMIESWGFCLDYEEDVFWRHKFLHGQKKKGQRRLILRITLWILCYLFCF